MPSTTTVTAPSAAPSSPRGGTLRSGGGNSQGCAEKNAKRSMAATALRASPLAKAFFVKNRLVWSCLATLGRARVLRRGLIPPLR